MNFITVFREIISRTVLTIDLKMGGELRALGQDAKKGHPIGHCFRNTSLYLDLSVGIISMENYIKNLIQALVN